jgi:hypothetical protein
MNRITVSDVVQAIRERLARPRNPLPVDFAEV